MRIEKGAGRRKRQIDVLPTLEIGWDRFGIDVAASFLYWYAWVEIWRPKQKV